MHRSFQIRLGFILEWATCEGRLTEGYFGCCCCLSERLGSRSLTFLRRISPTPESPGTPISSDEKKDSLKAKKDARSQKNLHTYFLSVLLSYTLSSVFCVQQTQGNNCASKLVISPSLSFALPKSSSTHQSFLPFCRSSVYRFGFPFSLGSDCKVQPNCFLTRLCHINTTTTNRCQRALK